MLPPKTAALPVNAVMVSIPLPGFMIPELWVVLRPVMLMPSAPLVRLAELFTLPTPLLVASARKTMSVAALIGPSNVILSYRGK